MNAQGQVVNVLSLIPGRAKKSWLCDKFCKIYDPCLIKRYQTFLEVVNICILKKVPKWVERLKECTLNISDIKLGHTHSCYINPTLCNGMLFPIQILSPHFPKVRNIKRLIYKLLYSYRKMLGIDAALKFSDMQALEEIVILAQEKADAYKCHQNNIMMSDDDIISKYSCAFKALTKRSMDVPRNICLSCERLCYRREVREIGKLRISLHKF